MSPVDQPRLPAEELESPIAFETLVADLSSRFINLPADDVDREIEHALGRVCELLGVDFAALWQWPAGVSGKVVPTHLHPRRDPDAPEPTLEDYPWYRQQMLAGRTVVITSLDQLPAEAAIDRESGRRVGIGSSVCLPMSVGQAAPFGAVAFNTLGTGREWSETLVKRLQLVTQVFANALARNSHHLRLAESEARLRAAADLAGLGFYDVDFGQGVMYVDDRLRDVCGVPPDREGGLGALGFWAEHLHPEDAQDVLDLREQMHAGEVDRISREYRYQHPVRGEVWIHHTGHVVARDAARRAVRTFGVLRDVTETKKVEGERRDFSRRLIRAQEAERALLARELHDDVSQRLAVLAINLGRAALARPGGSPVEILSKVRDDLVRLSEDVHASRISCTHRFWRSWVWPRHFERNANVGFGRARSKPRSIWSRCPRSSERTRPCVCFAWHRRRSPTWRATPARAGPSCPCDSVDAGLRLAVRDDGVGFEPGSGQVRSLGLASMRERAQLVGGTLDIESAPDRGTTVVAWVPAEGGPR